MLAAVEADRPLSMLVESSNCRLLRHSVRINTIDCLQFVSKVEARQDEKDWTKEKVIFDAAYGKERVPAFLFLPKDVRPPYQVVVFYPSSRVYSLPSSSTLGDM